MKRLNAKDGELTKEEIDQLIGFGSLIAGHKSPFRNEAERRKCLDDHEDELLRIFAKRHPGSRPHWWWKGRTPKRLVIGKSAYWSHHPARVKIFPVIESDSQYLFRTKTYFSFEKAAVIKQAAEDTASQREEIENNKELVALGHNTPFSRINGKEQPKLSGPAQRAEP